MILKSKNLIYKEKVNLPQLRKVNFFLWTANNWVQIIAKKILTRYINTVHIEANWSLEHPV
jgi:hypothetical protein